METESTKGTYQRREDNPAHEEPSPSLSSMARAIRQTTESQFLHLTVSCAHTHKNDNAGPATHFNSEQNLYFFVLCSFSSSLIGCLSVWQCGLRLIHCCSSLGKG